MKIQSLSIVVPTKRCVNNCPFCVSKMHDNDYKANFNTREYEKRIKYAVMNGVTSLIFTGTGEALQNTRFLAFISGILEKMGHPIPNVEIQTTGVYLQKFRDMIHPDSGEELVEYPNIELLKELGVNTISLSVSNIFDSRDNLATIGVAPHLSFDLDDICKFIKDQGFNLRLSLNMTDVYNVWTPEDIIGRCKGLGGDQITIRQLYESGKDTPEDKWVRENQMDYMRFGDVHSYVYKNGKKLYKLPFGGTVYSIDGMSFAVDDNCMAKENQKRQFDPNETLPTYGKYSKYEVEDIVKTQLTEDTLKYIIIRENGKMYCQWDDEGSLIF